MAETSRFDGLVDRVAELYAGEKPAEALALLEAESAGLEPWAADLAHLKACLLGVSGDADGALRTLQEASAAGLWWDPSILTGDDDLAALQDRPEFQELVAVSGERVSDDPVAPLIELPKGSVAGTVVALHGAGQRAAQAAEDWAGVLELGYALVCPTSSRRMTPMYRTWPDREKATADIARALGELPVELAGGPVIAAGFSAGGRAALDWALTARPSQPAGVLAMGPALRELPGTAAGKLSRATIWIGTEDGLLTTVTDAEEQLTELGLTVERVPELGHTFPADFSERLQQLLGQDS
ncbi:phospholipase [Kribbella sp. NPDC026611]|uniref:phospholipase n=1 Tax=Kribbella sp. NPDC026611 TaxID=3154911 RepID=UPI0033DF599C